MIIVCNHLDDQAMSKLLMKSTHHKIVPVAHKIVPVAHKIVPVAHKIVLVAHKSFCFSSIVRGAKLSWDCFEQKMMTKRMTMMNTMLTKNPGLFEIQVFKIKIVQMMELVGGKTFYWGDNKGSTLN